MLLPDYRGYGASDGEPDLDGAWLDVRASLREALARRARPDQPVYVFGQSLGGSLARSALADDPKKKKYVH